VPRGLATGPLFRVGVPLTETQFRGVFTAYQAGMP
jgi:hypothetical protein